MSQSSGPYDAGGGGSDRKLSSEAADHDIAGISADSRKIRPGMIFAALPGAAVDGRNFIADAVARGAVAVLAPPGTTWPVGVPPRALLIDAEPRRLLARLAAKLAGPLPRHVVAVTGTNGKTSTVDFIRQIFSRAGLRAASLGTLGLVAPGFAPSETLTTPDAETLVAMLADVKRAGIEHVALEASSHGLDQFRLDGLAIRVAGFSNLTRDHLDYHGGLAAYRAAKLRLFGEVMPRGGFAAVMADMETETLQALRGIAQERGLDLEIIGDASSRVEIRAIAPVPGGQILTLVLDGVERDIRVNLAGRFQADNALLAAALARAAGVADAFDYIPDLVGVRGRLEFVASTAGDAAVYVDYAHTPDAIERVLQALRPHTAGRLVIVFGAGGNRDRGKRPLMGYIASHLADLAIVTDDNPRGEMPGDIRAEIMAGSVSDGMIEIGDRRTAIAAGLDALRAGDVLVVAGKGHEQGQMIGDQTLPFDDAAVIRDILAAS
ncbi:MAG: UDP-N-acetylmuramoyl-L-alanyl-D-glutamate--2,6-diaminopimelate ligase [Rhodospirillales bacterium 20-60-12]|nr:MAG: UDP-N-acetylmuramoyl-L-alanyl-D-glutamate--2,6-diaminopimelate ligase [Rhodospirillales bacterium 20-60-12]HQT66768.1 UDP-N-acetylmuramoyl-L-alanyl-D-glutamate--2,6-diaminopimelate ligase [Acetobacteraceae bacterium]